ncbi:MAG TPA: hypothetical protein VJN94_07600 [Candidatus Binataceae bacterium]|nr:hypothetical protein [Candidatus Binataceae bacterium]
MNELKTDRRRFVVKTAAILLGSMLIPVTARRAAGAGNGAMKMGGMPMMGEGGVEGYIMNTSVTNHCGTCEYWGGPRRLSADGKTLTISGLGWCNNPDSPNYRKQTTPDHGPMSTWCKWRALS